MPFKSFEFGRSFEKGQRLHLWMAAIKNSWIPYMLLNKELVRRMHFSSSGRSSYNSTNITKTSGTRMNFEFFWIWCCPGFNAFSPPLFMSRFYTISVISLINELSLMLAKNLAPWVSYRHSFRGSSFIIFCWKQAPLYYLDSYYRD